MSVAQNVVSNEWERIWKKSAGGVISGIIPVMSGGNEENHDIPKPGEPMSATRLEARYCRIGNSSTKSLKLTAELLKIRSDQHNDKFHG
jgi:hypothetical protein